MSPRELYWSLLGRVLYRWSFHNAYRFRRLLLNLAGARLHPTAKIRARARVDKPWNFSAGEAVLIGDDARFFCGAPVSIGDRCTISQLATLCAETARRRGEVTAAPITIGSDSWVAADTLVLPGVTIGAGSVVGSRATVETDIQPWSVAVGEPARRIKARELASANTPETDP
ncbi:MAG: putative colanic acid biosynthesis acetyltransferase [Planctomycetota bacterium]